MCVIFVCDDARPTDIMIDKAWDRNDDGGGIAWQEERGGVREVVWQKGITDIEKLRTLIKAAPFPFVAHFRVASSGGVKEELTHPFPIDKKTTLALSGRTRGSILFHNGDWKGWPEVARLAAVHSRTPIPKGRWSDTRAMAWLCSIYGEGFMEFLPEQKGVIMGPNPEDIDVLTGSNGWNQINGVWCSNDYFMNQRVGSYTPTMCKYGSCRETSNLVYGYCKDHPNGLVAATIKPEAPLTGPQATTAAAASLLTLPATGGSQAPISFRQSGTKGPQAPLIRLEVAERLHLTKSPTGERLLSKGKIKLIRELYKKLEGKNVQKQLTAEKQLRHLSQQVLGSKHGLVH